MTELFESIQPDTILAVIPTLNEEDHIEACIRSLMAGSPALRKVPLIVADGGSRDNTVLVVKRLMLEFKNLSLIHNKKKLQAAALNLAAKESALPSSRWLVRCDAHSIYPENFIFQVARALEETEADSVVIPMDAIGRTCFEKANAWIVDTPLGSGGSAHRGGVRSGYVDHGHHAGFRLDVFGALGGYDESFSHNEDAEYDTRVIANGGRIYLDADIRIQYIPRGTVRGLSRQYFNYGKGRSRNAAKHNSPLKPRQMLPVLVLLASLGGLALGPIFPPALLLPLGYLGVLLLASAHMTLKHKSACGLLAGIALGSMHMSWAVGFIRHRLAWWTGRDALQIEAARLGQPIGPSRTIIGLGRAVNQVLGRKSAATNPARKVSAADGRSDITRVTRAPDGVCVYAIGDIHGRLDLLEKLLAEIEADASRLPKGVTPKLVFLGDYIDRGLQSRQIIDLFLSDRLKNFETVFLMGNHEEALLSFLQDPAFGEQWARYGGAETLFSYGYQPPVPPGGGRASAGDRDAWVTLWNQFRVGLPKDHLQFYRSLKYSYTAGDYIFVHAGLRPGVPLDQQNSQDMLWIRDEFLSDARGFDKLVVHGHTPTDGVYQDNRRIGVDTGAYMTGTLTAARLFQEDIDYVST